jgi:PST family polysaccharide transporter
MHNKINLKRLVAKGIGWLLVKRVFTQVILTFSNLILVRILFPQDFGIIVIIQFLVTIFWVFADLGLGRSLIQKKEEPDVVLLQSVWWTQVGLGLVVVGILWFASPLLVAYYGGHLPERAIEWIRILAVSQILVNMSGVSAVLLERRLDYKRIFIVETSGLFVTQVSTIILAIFGFGTVSFVFGALIGRVVAFFVYFKLSPWQWGFHVSLNDLKPLLSFGFSFQISIWLSIANGAVFPLFVGRFPCPGGWSVAQSVGFVSWASGVAALSGAMGEVINQFIFPLMSRLQEDKLLATEYFKRALWIVAVTAFGAVSLFFPLARDLISFVYTSNWLPALPAFYLALVQITIMAVTSLALNTLLAFGDAGYYRNMHFLWTVLQWGLTIPFVLLFGFWGVVLAGVLVSATALFALVRLKRYINLSYTNIVIKPLIVALSTGLLVFGLINIFPIDNFYHFFLAFVLGAGTYCCLTFLFMRKEFIENARIVRELVRIYQ